MSDAEFTVRFSDEGTLRKLKRTAAALGISTTELAEAAIARELALVGSEEEHRLARALERLKSAGQTGLDQDIQNFARGELEIEDPLSSSRVNLSGSLYQIVDELVRGGLTLEQARREFERQFIMASPKSGREKLQRSAKPKSRSKTKAKAGANQQLAGSKVDHSAREMPAANKTAGKTES